jgi:hypothetical protein
MMTKLLIFNDEQSFERAYAYAKKKGYKWKFAYAPTFTRLKNNLPPTTKNYALCLAYNEITKRKEITYGTKCFYLGHKDENISKYVLEDYRL